MRRAQAEELEVLRAQLETHQAPPSTALVRCCPPFGRRVPESETERTPAVSAFVQEAAGATGAAAAREEAEQPDSTAALRAEVLALCQQVSDLEGEVQEQQEEAARARRSAEQWHQAATEMQLAVDRLETQVRRSPPDVIKHHQRFPRQRTRPHC